MKPGDFLIIPTPHGVRMIVEGKELFRPYSADMLLNMGLRFIEAGKEAAKGHKDIMS